MKKNYSISMLRMLATFSIIICHTFEYVGHDLGYGEWIRIIGNYMAVGVQVFLVISGYLYGKRNELFFTESDKIRFVVKNFKKILIPYWLYLLLIALPIYCYLTPEQMTVNRIIYILLGNNYVIGIHHFWFIVYILMCYLITPMLYSIKVYFYENVNEKVKVYIYLFCLVIGVELFQYVFNLPFTMTWILCYIIGFFIPTIIEEKCKNRKILLFCGAILSIVFNMIRFYLRYICGCSNLPGIKGGIDQIL